MNQWTRKQSRIPRALLLVPILAMFASPGTLRAQTDQLPDPGMLPDNPLYFVKSMSEGIGTFLTFGDVAEAERSLDLAEQRLAEARALANEGKAEAAEKAVKRYEEQLERSQARAEEAREKGKDTEEVLTRTSEATLRHQVVLAEVYAKVPEQARPGIERAMRASMRGHEQSMRRVSRDKREEVLRDERGERREAEQRLRELRERGVPVPPLPSRDEIERPSRDRPEAGRPGGQDRPEGERGGAPDRPETGQPGGADRSDKSG